MTRPFFHTPTSVASLIARHHPLYNHGALNAEATSLSSESSESSNSAGGNKAGGELSSKGVSLPVYIFVTGGVVSSLGKGISAAALATLLEGHGYRVRMKKLDPYLNVDPGTMSPYQHGECFVTEDGSETDMDLGHYERFTGRNASRNDNITSGQVYQRVIDRERRGDFGGHTVQVVPHVTNEIKRFIDSQVEWSSDKGSDHGTPRNDNDGNKASVAGAASVSADIVMCEIGGTIGDIEGLPFVEAIRQLRNELGTHRCLIIHCTLVPWLEAVGELKTKPTQHSVKELLSHGLQPDILLCRSERVLAESERQKIALFSNVARKNVFSAVDVDSVYALPLAFRDSQLDSVVLDHFGLPQRPQRLQDELERWRTFVKKIRKTPGQRVIRIAVVGKYTEYKDTYKSLYEALVHASVTTDYKVEAIPLKAENFEESCLDDVQGMIVPGGFGLRGTHGMISAVRCARERGLPFLGICFGLQLALIEFARSCIGMSDANSLEFNPTTSAPVIGFLSEWQHNGIEQKRYQQGPMGGTMRLGSYPCNLVDGSLARQAYGSDVVAERHRHRYEVNPKFVRDFHDRGMVVTGWGQRIDKMSDESSLGSSLVVYDKDSIELVEVIELKNHPWFVAVQFHPELKSRPLAPHPLFVAFLQASVRYYHNQLSENLERVSS